MMDEDIARLGAQLADVRGKLEETRKRKVAVDAARRQIDLGDTLKAVGKLQALVPEAAAVGDLLDSLTERERTLADELSAAKLAERNTLETVRRENFQALHRDIVDALEGLLPALDVWTAAYVSGCDAGDGSIGHVRRVADEVQELVRDRETSARQKIERTVDWATEARKSELQNKAERAECELAEREIAYRQAAFDTVRPPKPAGPW